MVEVRQALVGDTGAHEGANEGAQRWRRLPMDAEPMALQLARSEVLLAEGRGEGGAVALRWYAPARPALTLGHGQAATVADGEACAARGVDVARRSSGGTAVLVDADALSLELTLPPGHALAQGDIVRGYEWVGELWAEALRGLGVAEARAMPTAEVRALEPLAKDDPLRMACYGTLSPWEVVVGRRKLVGLCQVRRRAGVLHQTGLHLRWKPEALVAVLALGAGERRALAPRLRDAAIGLDEAAGRVVTAEAVVDAVERVLGERLGVTLTRDGWSAAEVAEAEERAAAFRVG